MYISSGKRGGAEFRVAGTACLLRSFRNSGKKEKPLLITFGCVWTYKREEEIMIISVHAAIGQPITTISRCTVNNELHRKGKEHAS